MGSDVVFMGPPGSGKGTQAKALVDGQGWVQLSTGDLFRSHIARGTELGAQVKDILARGAYVPDNITVNMVRDRLREIPASKRILFDGFPRTVAQAQELDRLLGEFGRGLSAVVLLEVADTELLSRLSARAQIEKRTDDTPEVIAQRLAVYRQQTAPVIEFYRQRGLVRPVNGVGSVSEVAQRVLAAASVFVA